MVSISHKAGITSTRLKPSYIAGDIANEQHRLTDEATPPDLRLTSSGS